MNCVSFGQSLRKHRFAAYRAALAIAAPLGGALVGCTRGDTSVPPDVAPSATVQEAGEAPDVVSARPSAAPGPPSLDLPVAAGQLGSDVIEVPTPPADADPADSAGPLNRQTPDDAPGGERSVLTADSIVPSQPPSSDDEDGAVSVAAIAGQSLQLPADLTAPQLSEFLSRADEELFRIANQVRSAADRTAASAELKRVAGLKLQAAERLLAADAPSPELTRSGRRGKLQALSHLAAMGDIAAANRLRAYAAELATSTDDPRLLADSQMVLIGFALEDLQGGRLEDPSPIVDLVARLAANAEWLDMASLMAMGQARGVLQQYGYTEHARQVRNQILTAFSAHPDPQVASMALQLAGSDHFDALQSLRQEMDSGGTVTADQWRQAATDLARRAPAADSVLYLASAALQLEADGREELAEATYQVLRSEFDAAEPPLADEVQLVLRARDARRDAIGQTIDVDLPDLQGATIDWSSYRGRIVLMPFWAAGYPPSLEILPTLEKIQTQHPRQVAIVGINVDYPDTALGPFLQQRPMNWPSLRSTQPAQQGPTNPVAQQLGLASMPFVAVIDAQGRVAHISLDGRGVEDAVKQLLAQNEAK